MRSYRICLYFLTFLVPSVGFLGEALSQPSNGAATGKKTKSLETQKRVKFKERTEVNFEDAHIDGSYKSPLAQMINERDQDFKRGFISIRQNWHDQMIISTSGLGR